MTSDRRFEVLDAITEKTTTSINHECAMVLYIEKSKIPKSDLLGALFGILYHEWFHFSRHYKKGKRRATIEIWEKSQDRVHTHEVRNARFGLFS